MRAPGEVMAESRPVPTLPERSPLMPNGRASPLRSSGRSSPLRVSSPVPDRKDLANAATGAIEGINRAQLTLQELQELAERQRQQILYNSKELMAKQQQLMRMHQDFRTRLKVQGEPLPRQSQSQSPQYDRPPNSPRSPKSPTKKDQDQYARMLRQTYQSMGKIQGRSSVSNDIDIKKFNNVELAHELEKVRSIFSSKQNELAEAVRKVDVLTHQLDQRKNGESGHASLPTPERINRRKKIQAAKDELDRLRNELIVRNEMNSQQSHQLQLQRDIIHEKQQELRQLHTRMNELGTALKNKKAGAKVDLNRKPLNQALFNGTYLQDTLSRKRSGSATKILQDINANHVMPNDSTNNGYVNGVTETNGSKPVNKSIFEETPLSGNQIWRKDPVQNVRNDSQNKASPLHSPSSSVSSLSSLSSSSMTQDELPKPFSPNREAPPPPPPRSTPVGVLIDTRAETAKEPNEEFLAHLRSQKQRINELQKELENSNKTITSYTDSNLSSDSDKIKKYNQYGDASNSTTLESLSKLTPKKQVPPPSVKPKPVLLPKPMIEDKQPDVDVVDRVALPANSDVTEVDTFTVTEKIKTSDDVVGKDDETSDNMSWPSPPSLENVPSEPEDFELSFADIDEINDLQTDLWSNSESTVSQSSFDSDTESDIMNAVVPVVISVPPEKMPPPILMKPDKERKPKRRVILDPFALLLDAALEGEMPMVKETLRRVPDPSKPNAEGITALHNAVCGNHKEVVRYLVEVACDINSADNNGWTPLHCAAFYNDTELCSYLVEHGASVFATTYTDYQTPADKCSRLDDNYDACFGYLHECKENVGRINGGLVHALYDYTGENEDELSFYCGDELTVLRRGDMQEKEWWWARNRRGDTGYVPCNLIGNHPRIAAVV